MAKSIASINAGQVYLFRFDFSRFFDATNFEDGTGGKVKVTSNAHGLSNGDNIKIFGTIDYNGTYSVSNVTANDFKVTKAFNTNETLGFIDQTQSVYLTSAHQNINYDSKVWVAIGGAMQFENVSEETDLKSFGINLTLCGVDKTAIALILNKKYLGRTAYIYTIVCDNDAGTFDQPLTLFTGYMNGGFKIKETEIDGNPTVDISTTLSPRLTGNLSSQAMQTNTQSHQRHFPDDTFFDFVPSISKRDVHITIKFKMK